MHTFTLLSLVNHILTCILVKVQFREPKLYKKEGALFQEESYLLRIFRSSYSNLHTFHLINIVLWWQIFFRKHGKSTPHDRQNRHVLVVDVVTMTSQCRCTRPLSQSHVAKHINHVPVTAVDRFWDWLSCRYIGCRMEKSYRQKRENYIQIEAIHPQSYRQLVHEGIKIPGRHNTSCAPFF